MSKPVELRPQVEQRSGFPPQCSVEVKPQSPCSDEWRQKRYDQRRKTAARLGFDWDPKFCQKSAAYTIDGRHYCRGHAGQLAIEKWRDGDLVERRSHEADTK